MTLFDELMEALNKNGSASVLPFKVTALILNETTDERTEYDKCYETLIKYFLRIWAKRSVDSTTNRLSFVKDGNKLIVYKNF